MNPQDAIAIPKLLSLMNKVDITLALLTTTGLFVAAVPLYLLSCRNPIEKVCRFVEVTWNDGDELAALPCNMWEGLYGAELAIGNVDKLLFTDEFT